MVNGRSQALPVAALLLALTSCGAAHDPNQDVPSCAEQSCAEETKAVVEQLGELPDVARVTEVRWTRGKALSPPSISGNLTIRSANEEDCYTLQNDLERLAWTSSVAPLEAWSFDCYPMGSTSPTLVYGFWDASDADELDEKWGARGQS